MKYLHFAVVAAVLSLVPASAEEASVGVLGSAPMGAGGYQQMSAKVSYSDLDITSAQGAAVLFDRLDAASRAVCGGRPGFPRTAEHVREFDSCRAHARDAAVKVVGIPALTRVAASR